MYFQSVLYYRVYASYEPQGEIKGLRLEGPAVRGGS
jgi:hypothetical protein